MGGEENGGGHEAAEAKDGELLPHQEKSRHLGKQKPGGQHWPPGSGLEELSTLVQF